MANILVLFIRIFLPVTTFFVFSHSFHNSGTKWCSNTWQSPFTNVTSLSVYHVLFSSRNPTADACPCIAVLKRLPTTPDKFNTIHSSANVFFCDGAALFFIYIVPGPACHLGAFFSETKRSADRKCWRYLDVEEQVPLAIHLACHHTPLQD